MKRKQIFHTKEDRAEFLQHVKAALAVLADTTPPPSSLGRAFHLLAVAHAVLYELADIVEGADCP